MVQEKAQPREVGWTLGLFLQLSYGCAFFVLSDYREKGKTYPCQTEQLSPCFYPLPRKVLINSPQLAGTIDSVATYRDILKTR